MTPTKPVKAVVYARCSTDERRQDVETQLADLRRYAEAQGWSYEAISEYDSAYRGEQPKLQALLKRLKRREFSVLLVFSLDRFSREHPAKVNTLLDEIVYQHGCRFIALQEGLDSQNEMVWNVIKPLFSWFAHVFSRNLSEKIRAGIRHKREQGIYRGGRPQKKVDLARFKAIRAAHPDFGWRRLAQEYSENLPPKEQISPTLLRRAVQKLHFESPHKPAPV
jgi:DNA invertase Pin-like site-specific DNA recombinase